MSFNFTKEEFEKAHSQADYVALKKMAAERDKKEREKAREERQCTTSQRQEQRNLYEATMKRLKAEEAERERERERIENPKSPYAAHLADLNNPRSNNFLNMSDAERKSRIVAYTQADREWQLKEGERIKEEARQAAIDSDSEVIEMRNHWARVSQLKTYKDPEVVEVEAELQAYADAGAHREYWQRSYELAEKTIERRRKDIAEKEAVSKAANEQTQNAKVELQQVNDNRRFAEQHIGENENE